MNQLFRTSRPLRASTLWGLPVVAVLTAAGCGDEDARDDAKGGSSSTSGGRAGSSSGGQLGGGGRGAGGSLGGGGGETSPGGSGAGGENVSGAAGNGAASGDGGSGPEQGEGGARAALGGQGGDGGGPSERARCTADSTGVGQRLDLAPSGHDGLFGVTFDAQGFIYATGYVSAGIGNADNRETVVVKFDASGALVESFGTGGVAKLDVVNQGAGELPRGIVLQSDGKIVVAGTVEHDAAASGVLASDRDVYVARFDSDGALDETFGSAGIARLNLNDGVEGQNNMGQPALLGADAQWGLNVDASDRLLVHAAQRAAGFQSDGTTPRTDTDWAIVRLSKDGEVDTSFANAGKFTYDIGQASASARTLSLLGDGGIVAAGYSTYSGTQRPVLFKLGPDGQGPLWVFSEPVGFAAEAYGAALQASGKLVTAGYGRKSSSDTSTDFVSIRLTASGTLDTSFGESGARWLDAGGFGDNARTVSVLADDRVLLAGGGRLTADDTDGAIAILLPDGTPDVSFGDAGCRTYDFGTPGDFLWASALSPDKKSVALVGITGVATASSLDNDSTILVLPVE